MDPTKLITTLIDSLPGTNKPVAVLLVISIATTVLAMTIKPIGDVLKHFMYYVAIIICVLLLAFLIWPLGEEKLEVITDCLTRILNIIWGKEKDETLNPGVFNKLFKIKKKGDNEGGETPDNDKDRE